MTNQLRLPGLILLLAAASAAAVLDNGRIRVETRLVEGRLTEKYLARDGARWVEIAEFRASGRQLLRTIVPVSNGPWLRVTTHRTSASPSCIPREPRRPASRASASRAKLARNQARS